MKIHQETIRNIAQAPAALENLAAVQPQLLLVFAGIGLLTAGGLVKQLRQRFPHCVLIGCSTAGEIDNSGVNDDSAVLTAVHFDTSRISVASTALASMDDSFAAGKRLGESLADPALKGILMFGPGVGINGSALVRGLSERIGEQIPITGGLAGDAGAFRQTWTLGPEGLSDDSIVAIGLHGEQLTLAHGSFGGWEAFGPARRVTRCSGNVLFELDGEPALDIYKRYLGTHAAGLPASGLLFPFAMLGEDHHALGLIRTILAVDDASGSLTLAGEISENGYLKLMHASTDKLVNGAEHAALDASRMLAGGAAQLAILVSCVGRKLVMGNRVDEEVEAVQDSLGEHTQLAGFYSYGEISPFSDAMRCQLHNQTMTITCIGEN